mmetsp:Transcript_2192/g.5837  ORF Transcript_2192/g.5837 Transcript_2192/m.5837 type:complete len:307 (+) Transcript_2192:153-1073(+)
MVSSSPRPPSIDDAEPDAADVSDLMHEHRRTVLRLAREHRGSEIAWDVSQSVLDRLWEQQSAAAAPNDPAGRGAVASGTAAAPPSKQGAVTAYACQGCGVRLHPGWEGSTLRVQRPGKWSTPSARRTVRRRALRKRRAAALAAERDRRVRNHRRTPPSGGAKPWLVVLRDDPVGPLDRNRLVLTCGLCRHKTYLKGLRRDLPVPSPPRQTAASKAPTTPVAVPPRTTGGVANLSENFERLPELPGKTSKKSKPRANHPPTATAGGATKAPSTSMSLLEQKMGRKKKKKPPPSGGNLMSFLSSLNDH